MITTRKLNCTFCLIGKIAVVDTCGFYSVVNVFSYWSIRCEMNFGEMGGLMAIADVNSVNLFLLFIYLIVRDRFMSLRRYLFGIRRRELYLILISFRFNKKILKKILFDQMCFSYCNCRFYCYCYCNQVDS